MKWNNKSEHNLQHINVALDLVSISRRGVDMYNKYFSYIKHFILFFNTDSSSPNCQPIYTPLYGYPPTCTNRYNIGSKCTFQCVSPHVLNGMNVLTCLDRGDTVPASWDHRTPTCAVESGSIFCLLCFRHSSI